MKITWLIKRVQTTCTFMNKKRVWEDYLSSDMNTSQSDSYGVAVMRSSDDDIFRSCQSEQHIQPYILSSTRYAYNSGLFFYFVCHFALPCRHWAILSIDSRNAWLAGFSHCKWRKPEEYRLISHESINRFCSCNSKATVILIECQAYLH